MADSYVDRPDGGRVFFRHEYVTMHTLDRRTGRVRRTPSLVVHWRRRAGARWQHKVLVPDQAAGQTMADVAEQLDAVVLQLDREYPS